MPIYICMYIPKYICRYIYVYIYVSVYVSLSLYIYIYVDGFAIQARAPRLAGRSPEADLFRADVEQAIGASTAVQARQLWFGVNPNCFCF